MSSKVLCRQSAVKSKNEITKKSVKSTGLAYTLGAFNLPGGGGEVRCNITKKRCLLLRVFWLLAFYICCCVSMFTQKKRLLRTGTVGIAVLYILLFVIIFIAFTQESYGVESLASQVGFGFMFFLFVGCVVLIMAYFSLGGLAKKLENRISIKKYWYRPGIYFVACFVSMLIALSSFASKYGSSLSNLNFGSLFSNWTNFLWIAVFIFSGMALYTEENPTAFSGAGNMYNQQMNPYGQPINQYNQQVNPYGQPINQYNQQVNPYGQQPQLQSPSNDPYNQGPYNM